MSFFRLFFFSPVLVRGQSLGEGGGLERCFIFIFFVVKSWAVSSGSCAWLPFHRVSVLQPAERNVLILVRSRVFAYYLRPNAARLGNGAEISSTRFFFGVSRGVSGASDALHTLIRRSSPGCIRCPEAQHYRQPYQTLEVALELMNLGNEIQICVATTKFFAQSLFFFSFTPPHVLTSPLLRRHHLCDRL